jgi:hypothetical protein
VRASNGLPSTCSGDMYTIVPKAAPDFVRCSAARGDAVWVFCAAIWLGGLVRIITLGQPEIQDLGVPTLSHENIRGLDVAVNDTLRVSCIQRIGNLDRQ